MGLCPECGAFCMGKGATNAHIKQKHRDIIEENGLNLSKWVRKQLEKQFE